MLPLTPERSNCSALLLESGRSTLIKKGISARRAPMSHHRYRELSSLVFGSPPPRDDGLHRVLELLFHPKNRHPRRTSAMSPVPVSPVSPFRVLFPGINAAWIPKSPAPRTRLKLAISPHSSYVLVVRASQKTTWPRPRSARLTDDLPKNSTIDPGVCRE